jgi:hypothetical protein
MQEQQPAHRVRLPESKFWIAKEVSLRENSENRIFRSTMRCPTANFELPPFLAPEQAAEKWLIHAGDG